MYGELSRLIVDLVKNGFPEIASVFRYHARARVISTDRDKGVATIHPLRPDMTDDAESPDIEDVDLPRIPTPNGPAYIIPDNGELVSLVYYYDAPDQPKIIECLGKGYIYGDMHWTTKDEHATYALKGSDTAALADNDIIFHADNNADFQGKKITVGGSSSTVNIG